jgi:hypothetical protein
MPGTEEVGVVERNPNPNPSPQKRRRKRRIQIFTYAPLPGAMGTVSSVR